MIDETTPDQDSEDEGGGQRRGGLRGFLRETAMVVVLALVIATLVRVFLVQAFAIPSGSMEDTLEIGDRVLVSKISTRFGDVERGDIVVFKDPGNWLSDQSEGSGGVGEAVRNAFEFIGLAPDDSEGHLIKRVIAVGGDTVDCCDDQDRVTVNGHPIDESEYLFPGAEPSRPFDDGPVVVPEGELFVMGDNRANSRDSRVQGTVPEDLVEGKAFAVIWPISQWGGLSRPDAFNDVPVP